jgi:predicted enzyme related to lactoylglutathione lyase
MPSGPTGHRSRLCAALIDVPATDYGRDVAFWAAALDRNGVPEDDDPDYTTFGQATAGVEFMVQSVGGNQPRIHFDIETDDVDAEVARLEDLGASVIERIESWVVMQDPVGIVFCVVRVQLPEAFETSATTWTA